MNFQNLKAVREAKGYSLRDAEKLLKIIKELQMDDYKLEENMVGIAIKLRRSTRC